MQKQWWHDKVAYQIYPKSFNDTNGDGIGDLRGIIEKLDYLKELGIDIVWLSPIYQSPFVDQGYDISDYYKIDSRFGTMDDFDELIAEARKRGMYIIMDLVINHCSDQHEWFRKALKDPAGKYGDYFYFRKGKNGNPPCNYRSYFGGSAWEKVKNTEYYYLHMFAKEQPDLNWNNPQVLEELYKMVNWWLDKGVAGFRIDAIINIKKDLEFKDLEPDGEDGLAGVWKMVESVDGVGELLEDLKKHTFEKYNAFTVAEVFNMKKDELREFIGDHGHFSTMFDFSAHSLFFNDYTSCEYKELDIRQLKQAMFHSQLECEDVGFLANIIENHDEPRGASRYLPKYLQNENGVKMLGTISILLRGIPFVYQGQEIGMRNCRFSTIDEYDDISTKAEYADAIKAGVDPAKALEYCYHASRDNARTPMQWADAPNAGFSTGKPWLKVNPNYHEINVEEQETRRDSVLQYYRQLIALRKSEQYKEVFTYGQFRPLYEDSKELYAYERSTQQQNIRIIANYGGEDVSIPWENTYKLLLNNMKELLTEEGRASLRSGQVIVLEV